MIPHTRIFDMSGVYAEEGFSIEGARVLDCRGLEGTNCWCSGESAEVILAMIADTENAGGISGSPAGTAPPVNWTDTGDYHYLSALLCSRVKEPFELILADNHPDDQPSAFDDGSTLSCGNWVKWLQDRCPMLSGRTWLRTAEDLRQYRVGQEALPVHISIDLDILRRSDFATDWDQSDVSAQELYRMLQDILRTRRVLGIDICGGITCAKGACSCELDANRELRYCLNSKISQYLRI